MLHLLLFHSSTSMDILKHNLGYLRLYFFQRFLFKSMVLKLPLEFVPLRKDRALVKEGT